MDELQFIYGMQSGLETKTKEVKVRLPVQHLIRLHGLKLLAGQNISDTITEALVDYFGKLDAQKAARAVAVQASPVGT